MDTVETSGGWGFFVMVTLVVVLLVVGSIVVTNNIRETTQANASAQVQQTKQTEIIQRESTERTLATEAERTVRFQSFLVAMATVGSDLPTNLIVWCIVAVIAFYFIVVRKGAKL